MDWNEVLQKQGKRKTKSEFHILSVSIYFRLDTCMFLCVYEMCMHASLNNWMKLISSVNNDSRNIYRQIHALSHTYPLVWTSFSYEHAQRRMMSNVNRQILLHISKRFPDVAYVIILSCDTDKLGCSSSSFINITAVLLLSSASSSSQPQTYIFYARCRTSYSRWIISCSDR